MIYRVAQYSYDTEKDGRAKKAVFKQIVFDTIKRGEDAKLKAIANLDGDRKGQIDEYLEKLYKIYDNL